MTIGSKNKNHERASSDLGRFGLGLKTASFSQCRSLTVESFSKENKELFVKIEMIAIVIEATKNKDLP